MNIRHSEITPAASGRRRAIFGTRAKTGALLLLLCLAVGVSQFPLGSRSEFRTHFPPRSVAAAKSHNYSYFRSGQWLADARTLAAAYRWLLDCDDAGPFNA